MYTYHYRNLKKTYRANEKKLTHMYMWRRLEMHGKFWLSTKWMIPFKKYHSKIYRNSRPEVFHKEDVLNKFGNFPGKRLCRSFLFNEVADSRSATLSKKTFWRRCFSVNFAKFLRTAIKIWDELALRLSFLFLAHTFKGFFSLKLTRFTLGDRMLQFVLASNFSFYFSQFKTLLDEAIV